MFDQVYVLYDYETVIPPPAWITSIQKKSINKVCVCKLTHASGEYRRYIPHLKNSLKKKHQTCLFIQYTSEESFSEQHMKSVVSQWHMFQKTKMDLGVLLFDCQFTHFLDTKYHSIKKVLDAPVINTFAVKGDYIRTILLRMGSSKSSKSAPYSLTEHWGSLKKDGLWYIMKHSIKNVSSLYPSTREVVVTYSSNSRVRSGCGDTNFGPHSPPVGSCPKEKENPLAQSMYSPTQTIAEVSSSPSTTDHNQTSDVDDTDADADNQQKLRYVIVVRASSNTIQNIKRLMLLDLKYWGREYPSICILYFIGDPGIDTDVIDTGDHMDRQRIIYLKCSDDNLLHSPQKCIRSLSYVKKTYPNIAGVLCTTIHELPLFIKHIRLILEKVSRTSYAGLQQNLVPLMQTTTKQTSILSMCTISEREFHHQQYVTLFPKLPTSIMDIECAYFSSNIYLSMGSVDILLSPTSVYYFGDITNTRHWLSYHTGGCVYKCLPVHIGYSIAYVLSRLNKIDPICITVDDI